MFVVGALVPNGFALGSLMNGDMRLVAASRMFDMFSWVCSVAAAIGNPRNFGSRNEKLFIGLCSLLPAAYRAIVAYALGSTDLLIYACGFALILPHATLAELNSTKISPIGSSEWQSRRYSSPLVASSFRCSTTVPSHSAASWPLPLMPKLTSWGLLSAVEILHIPPSGYQLS